MIDWFNGLPNASKATIVGTLIGASMTAVIAVLTIIFKDYFLPILAEKRLSGSKRMQSFKEYSNPLILSSISFLYRIKEIFGRGHFLLDETPKNNYNEYKYLSTLYRLCTLLGWIRAIKIELSYIEVKNTKEFEKIDAALNNFEKSLADGEHIELSRLEHLCEIWNLDFKNISVTDKKYLGTEIENLIDKATFKESIETPKDLDNSSKKIVARSICDLICNKSGNAILNDIVLEENLNVSIQEMSRIESWIYRDWQSAIGDLIIKTNNSGQKRKYDVISYLEFEDLCFNGDNNSKKWLKRVETLFINLDVAVEDRFDARKQQLKNTYNSVVALIEVFSFVSNSNVDLTKKALKNLKGKIQ